MSVNIPIQADLNSGSFAVIKNGLNEIARAAGLSEKEIADMNQRIDESGKKANKAYSDTNKQLINTKDLARSAGQALLATFSVQLLIAFQKQIFNITAEFQKMEAVLTNTLGSRSAAQLAMAQIVQFATKTPFQVGELTESFIKLANQGFKPTLSEMRKLGDLASSTGKQYIQLTEAIIDAQVGEFERLKEFGIRAKQEGDRVIFTFKGVTTEVEKSDKSIRNYILSLGDAEGVSGSMAAISGTLAGKVSNIGDNIDQLSKAIGNKQSGVFATSIDWLNEFLRLATLAVQETSDLRNEIRKVSDAEVFSETNKEVDALIEKYSQWMSREEAINKAIDDTKASYQNLSDDISKGIITAGMIGKQGRELEEYRIQKLKELTEEQDKKNEKDAAAQKKADEAAAKEAEREAKRRADEEKRIAALGIIGKLEYEISELQKSRINADSIQELSLIDRRIAKRKEEIALIELMAGGINAPSRMNPFAEWPEETKKALDKMNEVQRKAFEDSIAKSIKFMEDTKNITQQVKDFWRDWSEQISWTVLDTYMNIEERGRMNTEKEIQRLEMEKEARLQLAGEDKDQRLLIEQEFQAKQEELKAKERARLIREAIAQRGLTLFNIFRNTAEASVAALAPPPLGFGPVAGIPVSAGIKIAGLLQAAAVVSQPLPKFAKGVYNLNGPGTETSDSIPAMLSKGESVVPAKRSAMFKDIIQPMIEDQHFNYEKLLGIAMEKVNPRLRGDLFKEGRQKTEDGRLIHEIQGLRRDMKGKPGTQIIIDQDGVRQGRKTRQRFQNQIDSFLYD